MAGLKQWRIYFIVGGVLKGQKWGNGGGRRHGGVGEWTSGGWGERAGSETGAYGGRWGGRGGGEILHRKSLPPRRKWR